MLRFIVASLLVASISAGDADFNGESDPAVKQANENFKDGLSYLEVSHLPEKEAKSGDIRVSAMKFYLYTREQPYRVELNINDANSIVNSSYNPFKSTKFLVHGWLQTPETFMDIINDYLYVQNLNVIVMDWSMYSKEYNFESTTNVVVPKAAEALSILMRQLTGFGALPNEHFHGIGVGAGAHILGIAGKYASPLRMKRISALDPLGYGYDYPGKQKLQNGDAEFVDVMHTNAGLIGSDRAIGDLAFHPNGGNHPQPPCPTGRDGIVCSSLISLQYWRESITRPQAFEAIRCQNWPQFLSNHCPQPTVYTTMGEHANSMARRGMYYLQTNAQKPYSKSPKPQ